MFPIAKIIAVIATAIHIGTALFYSQPVPSHDSRISFKCQTSDFVNQAHPDELVCVSFAALHGVGKLLQGCPRTSTLRVVTQGCPVTATAG